MCLQSGRSAVSGSPNALHIAEANFLYVVVGGVVYAFISDTAASPALGNTILAARLFRSTDNGDTIST